MWFNTLLWFWMFVIKKLIKPTTSVFTIINYSSFPGPNVLIIVSRSKWPHNVCSYRFLWAFRVCRVHISTKRPAHASFTSWTAVRDAQNFGGDDKCRVKPHLFGFEGAASLCCTRKPTCYEHEPRKFQINFTRRSKDTGRRTTESDRSRQGDRHQNTEPGMCVCVGEGWRGGWSKHIAVTMVTKPSPDTPISETAAGGPLLRRHTCAHTEKCEPVVFHWSSVCIILTLKYTQTERHAHTNTQLHTQDPC